MILVNQSTESIIVKDSTYLEPSSLRSWYSELSKSEWLKTPIGAEERIIPIKEKDLIVSDFSHSSWFSHIFESHRDYERTDPFAISVFSTFFFCLSSYIDSYDSVPDLRLNFFKYIYGSNMEIFEITEGLFHSDDLLMITSLSHREVIVLGDQEYVLNPGDTVVCPAHYFAKYLGEPSKTLHLIVASMSRL
jgi:hypothetical protein